MRNLPWLWLSALVFVFDQLAKGWVQQNFIHHQRWDIAPFFSMLLTYNKGAAFSFLSTESGWQRWFFIGIALVISMVLVRWLYTLQSQQKRLAAALSLILGGALGNLYDRIALGKVVDFLLFHYHGWYFPAFNLADSAITLGAVVLIVDALYKKTPTNG